MTRDEIRLALLVAYGFVLLGFLIVFQQNQWRMPDWLGLSLVTVGVLLIGWALWADHSRKSRS